MSPPRPTSEDQTRTLGLDQPATGPVLVAMWEGGVVRVPAQVGQTLVVGRGDDCDVQIVHAALSRRHLAIHVGTTPSVEDLGSMNGTQLGGVTLRSGSSAAIPPGALVA